MPSWSHRNAKTVQKRQANDFPVCGKRSINLLRTFYGCPAGDVPFPPPSLCFHPYNEIERKKGSHPSYYLRIKWLRWTLHSNSLHKGFTEKFRSTLWYNTLRWTFSRHSQKRKINALYGSRMKKLCAISSISFRKGSLVAHCTMVMHRKGLSL